jgi:hypothetical protein
VTSPAPAYPASRTLDATTRWLPRALASPAAVARVRRVAARLPAALLSAFYLECRLGSRDPRVDWIVRVDAPGRDVLAGRNPRVALPDALRAHPAWAQVAELCAAWTDDTRLRSLVSHLWLEFDVPAHRGGSVPAPSVFVALDRAAAARLGEHDWRALTAAVTDRLRPDLPFLARRAVGDVVAGRPAGAGVPYLGYMLARAEGAVRVYFSSIAPAALPRALRAVGWPGEPDELALLLRRLGRAPGPAPFLAMSYLDLAEGVLPAVGVEYKLRRAGQSRGKLAERAFLDGLVEMGVCTAARRRGIDGWPGARVEMLPHELWESLGTRRVNHVKLVHRPGVPPMAKAYLHAGWSPRAATRACVPEAAAGAP